MMCKHELPPAQCWLCLHPRAARARRRLRIERAPEDGICKLCDKHISVGERITRAPDRLWVHVECALEFGFDPRWLPSEARIDKQDAPENIQQAARVEFARYERWRFDDLKALWPLEDERR